MFILSISFIMTDFAVSVDVGVGRIMSSSKRRTSTREGSRVYLDVSKVEM
jgi:hypothetical protein